MRLYGDFAAEGLPESETTWSISSGRIFGLTGTASEPALDRVLISGFYVMPLFHAPGQWIARWTRVERPDKGSLYGAEPTTWWAVE